MRTARRRGLAALLLGVLSMPMALLTPPALAHSDRGHLHGRVVGEDGERLMGAAVYLRDLEGFGISREQQTGALGAFRFPGLDPGIYEIEVGLDGFSTAIFEAVTIRADRSTSLVVRLAPTEDEIIEVSTESPPLDERRVTRGRSVSQLELEKIPSTGLVAGLDPTGALDLLFVDGVELGDDESLEPGMLGAFEDPIVLAETLGGRVAENVAEISVTSGGSDAALARSGVRLNLVTKRGSKTWRGSGAYLFSDESLQDRSALDRDDLPPRQRAEIEGLVGDHLEKATSWGGALGGALIQERAWIWGSAGENKSHRTVFGGQSEASRLENQAVKANARITDSNSLVVARHAWQRSGEGRGAGPSRSPETTWNPDGDTSSIKIEDQHVHGGSFLLVGSWSRVDDELFLEPAGGRDVTAWRDADRVWHGSFLFGESDRHTECYALEGSHRIAAFGLSHELRWGASVRDVEDETLHGAPGDGALHLAQTGIERDGTVLALAQRRSLHRARGEDTALWLQDTVTTDRLTLNLGVRYDEQEVSVGAGRALGTPFDPELFPAFSTTGGVEAVRVENFLPRLGLTYAFGEDRETLVRASFGQFADRLALDWARVLDPVGPATAFYLGRDLDGDGILEPTRGETATLLGTEGFDAAAPAATLAPSRIDPDLEAVVTSEAILGVEHALIPELVGHLTLVWRRTSDHFQAIPIYRDPQSGQTVLATRELYVQEGVVSGLLPDGTPVSVPVFEVADGLEDTGGTFWTHTDRSTELFGLTAGFTTYFAGGFMVRALAALYDWEWEIGPEFRRFDNPANQVDGGAESDDDGALVAPGAGEPFRGLGGEELHRSSRYSFEISGFYQLANGVTLSASIHGREGHPLAYGFYDVATSRGSIDLEAEPLGTSRLEDVILTDLRVDRAFHVGELEVSVGLDLFNLFDQNTVLRREVALSADANAPGRGGFAERVLGPRRAQLGVRLAWK